MGLRRQDNQSCLSASLRHLRTSRSVNFQGLSSTSPLNCLAFSHRTTSSSVERRTVIFSILICLLPLNKAKPPLTSTTLPTSTSFGTVVVAGFVDSWKSTFDTSVTHSMHKPSLSSTV